MGAGKTADKIAREILTTARSKYDLVGFIDDSIKKQGALLHGKKIFCGLTDLQNLKVEYDEIIVTSPSFSGNKMRKIIETCKELNKSYKTVPGNELIDGEISIERVRPVKYSDL